MYTCATLPIRWVHVNTYIWKLIYIFIYIWRHHCQHIFRAAKVTKGSLAHVRSDRLTTGSTPARTSRGRCPGGLQASAEGSDPRPRAVLLRSNRFSGGVSTNPSPSQRSTQFPSPDTAASRRGASSGPRPRARDTPRPTGPPWTGRCRRRCWRSGSRPWCRSRPRTPPCPWWPPRRRPRCRCRPRTRSARAPPRYTTISNRRPTKASAGAPSTTSRSFWARCRPDPASTTATSSRQSLSRRSWRPSPRRPR